jgi:hypothetical protein
MDDMTILALAPRTGIRNQLLDDLPQHLTRTRSATARITNGFHETEKAKHPDDARLAASFG